MSARRFTFVRHELCYKTGPRRRRVQHELIVKHLTLWAILWLLPRQPAWPAQFRSPLRHDGPDSLVIVTLNPVLRAQVERSHQ